MFHMPVPLRQLALILLLPVLLLACSTAGPAVDSAPDGDSDSRIEAPADDNGSPGDEDEEDSGSEDETGSDEDSEDSTGDAPGDEGDDAEEPGDEDSDVDEPGDDGSNEDDGDDGSDATEPLEAPLRLQTNLNVHTMMDESGSEVTILILNGTIRLDETAPAAAAITVTLLTGDGIVSGEPRVIDVAEGADEFQIGLEGHDWGQLAASSYRVQVEYAGGRSFSEHDLSSLPYGLELPADIAITMVSPTQMRVTFEPAAEARLHTVRATYVAADGSVRTAVGMRSSDREAVFSSTANFDVVLGQEYELRVFADISEQHGEGRVTRVTGEAVATLTLGQVPVISAWAGPFSGELDFDGVDESDSESVIARVFVTLPAGAEPGTTVEASVSIPGFSFTPDPFDFGEGISQAWLLPLADLQPGDTTINVNLSRNGELLADYERTFEGVATVGGLNPPRISWDKSRLTANRLQLHWLKVDEATHYLIEIFSSDSFLVFHQVTDTRGLAVEFTDDFRLHSDNLGDYMIRVYALDGDPDDPTERIVRVGGYAALLTNIPAKPGSPDVKRNLSELRTATIRQPLEE